MSERGGNNLSTHSAWERLDDMPQYPPVSEDLVADVVVVGGGIAGVTTAYLLAQAGRSVVLVDQNQPGRGMTGHTTAHLTLVQDRRFVDIEKRFDRETALAVGQSHLAAIEFIEHIARDNAVDCDFQRVPGYLVDTADELAGNDLVREMSLMHEIGLRDTTPFSAGEAPVLHSGRGLRIPSQGRVRILGYLKGLLRLAEKDGARVHGDTHVTEVLEDAVRTQGGHHIRADATILATHIPIQAIELATKLTPMTTYVVAGKVPTGSVEDAVYWDTEDPYHYVRLQPLDAHDLVIVGGADHRTGEVPDEADLRFSELEAWARGRIPELQEIEYRWTGQVFDPVDGVAYIGKSPEHKGNTFVATGFSGNGITHGTIAGMVLADLVIRDRSPWADIYDPGRKKGLLSREGILHNVAAVKHMVADRLRKQGPKTAEELAPGTGGIIARGKDRIAAYRHDDGRIEEHSAVCTHVGCIVQWNQIEKTFDCPCHGSQFRTDGTVVSGPAVAPLQPVDGKKREREQEGKRR